MWLGLGLGAGASTANEALVPAFGMFALPLVVFLATLLVVGLRATRVVSNMLAWFVGMVTFFAAQAKPSVESSLPLLVASLVGGLAGFLCHTVAPRLEPPPSAT
jgi:hypothetical protein